MIIQKYKGERGGAEGWGGGEEEEVSHVSHLALLHLTSFHAFVLTLFSTHYAHVLLSLVLPHFTLTPSMASSLLLTVLQTGHSGDNRGGAVERGGTVLHDVITLVCAPIACALFGLTTSSVMFAPIVLPSCLLFCLCTGVMSLVCVSTPSQYYTCSPIFDVVSCTWITI
jgi:hypothetical protein